MYLNCLVHDADLDDDEDMCEDSNFGKSICCGHRVPETVKLRGTISTFCQVVTKALSSSDCRDSLKMPWQV